jgi:Biopolymer transport protein ExbD/TolR
MLAHPILHWETTAMAFSTTGASGGASLTSEINVTPLIDVLLVMLIIFMVIVPVMPRGLNSALPLRLRSRSRRRCGAPCPGTGGAGTDSGAVLGGWSWHGESRGRAAIAGASVAKIRSAGTAQGGCEAGLRRYCGRDRRRSGRGSGERRIGNSRSREVTQIRPQEAQDPVVGQFE